MKNLLAIAVLLLSTAALATAQDMSCTKTPGHDICQFSDGSVIETFDSPGHYAQYHWEADKWNEELMKRSPARSTAQCLADKLINGESVCAVVWESCQADTKHPRFSKVQCGKVFDHLNAPEAK
jgi:hypothetical protein